MNTIAEIKKSLEGLAADELARIARWLQEFMCTSGTGGGEVRERKFQETPDQPLFMTQEEYMRLEEKSALRHEYVNGLVYAMGGASLAHNRIARRLLAALETFLLGGPCEPFILDAKLEIRIDSDQIVYYPDLMVACRPQEQTGTCVRNPVLVTEILSPSTRHIDLREKVMCYGRVASIEEYLVLSQDECRAILYRRAEGWRPRVHARPDALIEFRSIGMSWALASVYEGTLC